VFLNYCLKNYIKRTDPIFLLAAPVALPEEDKLGDDSVRVPPLPIPNRALSSTTAIFSDMGRRRLSSLK
jgi:hypothetical protein